MASITPRTFVAPVAHRVSSPFLEGMLPQDLFALASSICDFFWLDGAAPGLDGWSYFGLHAKETLLPQNFRAQHPSAPQVKSRGDLCLQHLATRSTPRFEHCDAPPFKGGCV